MKNGSNEKFKYKNKIDIDFKYKCKPLFKNVKSNLKIHREKLGTVRNV